MPQPNVPGSSRPEVTTPGERDSVHYLDRSQLQRISKQVKKAERKPQNAPRGAATDKPNTSPNLCGQLAAAPYNDGTKHPGSFTPYYASKPYLDSGDGSQPDQTEPAIECWDYSLPSGYRTGTGWVTCSWIGGRWLVQPGGNCPEKIGTPAPPDDDGGDGG